MAKLLDSHGQPPALALDTTNPASLLKWENNLLCISLLILFEPRAVNTVMTRHGKLDILLNNAGVATRWVILVNMVISVILGHEKTKIQNILDLGKIDVFSVRTNIYIKNKKI